MENQHGRNDLFPNQHDSRFSQNYSGNGRTMTSLMMSSNNDVSSTSGSSCGREGDRQIPGLPPNYPLLSGLPFDPTLHPFLQSNLIPMRHIHPALLANHHQLQPPNSALNQRNPVPMFSTNDNNNCNRGRAASHSSVLEPHPIGTHGHLPLHPSYHLPSSYYDAHKNQTPTYLPQNISSPGGYRRNSTTAVFPHTDSDAPHNLPHGVNLSTLPQASHHPLAYLMSRGIIPPYPHYKDFYPYPDDRRGFRRSRYSIGAALPSNGQISANIEPRRRNSIPTALELQQVVDESTDDDDDDVFDSEPAQNERAQDAVTDSKSYLEQLRESRKRALSSGEPSSSRKQVCRDDNGPRSARCFRRRITHEENDDPMVTSVSRAYSERGEIHSVQTASSNHPIPHHRVGVTNNSYIQNKTSGLPGPSAPPVANTEPMDIQAVTRTKPVIIKAISHQARKIPERADKEAPSKAPPSTSAIQTNVIRRTLTPSPSILKKSPRINRNFNGNSRDSNSGQSVIFHSKSKSLPLKKQVAWRDKPKERSIATSSDHDVIMSPMNHDLLSEENLIEIRKNPKDFTVENRIGPYIIGPQIGTSPVKSITQYLVRKENTYKYYMAKVLTMGSLANDKDGRMLLYSEHTLLTLLKNHPGVVTHHGFHKDIAFNKKNGKAQERLCLVLDCLTQHDFDESSRDYLNLQQHVIQVKRLSERDTIRVFMSIIEVVLSLHELDVVHRDLKLGNMVLNKKTQKIILTNFCLGRHLMSSSELLKDQRGSPAYISPDVLSGKPYAGKPSDMWSLGVVLFMMLYGKFPFYDQEASELFRKIKKADFVIPSDIRTTSNINDVIRGLLTLDPAQRLTAQDTLVTLHRCANSLIQIRFPSLEAQVVPDVDKDSSSDEDDKNDELEQQRYLEEKLTQDFQRKMMSDDDETDSAENHVKGFSRYQYQATHPTIHHVGYDAQPLTANEIAIHRQLIANSNLGTQG